MEIEGEYYNFPGDKDEFCKMWKGRDQIQTRLKSCQELTDRIRLNLMDINMRRMKTADSRTKKKVKKPRKENPQGIRAFRVRMCRPNCET